MSLTREQVLHALGSVRYPGFTRDIVSFGIVREAEVRDGEVRVRIDIGAGNPAVAAEIEREARATLQRLEGVGNVHVVMASPPPTGLRMAGPAPGPAGALDGALLPGVRHVIAVASGKGGVGKSTVAVNLAVALARTGARIGLLDADIYGPSIPLMMGTDERPRLDDQGRRLLPFERYGVSFMSLGFLVERESAVIWRGPMVMKAVSQLLSDVLWGELDVLVVDMPPGTGDAQLTLSQKVELAGALIVTTPQDVALTDAIKGVAMFRKVGVPVLGIVENMSFFVCPDCGSRSEIFGHGGGRRHADRLGVPFLGEIALDASIRDSGDTGRPIADAAPDSTPGRTFLEIANRLLASLPEMPRGEADSRGPFARFREGFSGREE